MPTLPGMKGSGYYDRNSSFQRATMEAALDWVQQAAAQLALPAEPWPITIADYGCSEGRNSTLAVGHAVAALRQRRPNQPICAVHADLPTNNFNQLFRNLHDAGQDNYLHRDGQAQPNVFALAVGGSFYGPLLPPGTVHLAMSFLAVEWMDRVPDVPVPEAIGYMAGSPAALAAYAAQADEDLTRFYEARARELAPGGKLFLIIPGRDASVSCSDGLYHVFNDAAGDLVQAGRIDRRRFEQFVMPVYFRNLEEMTAPLSRPSSPLADAFALDRAEVLELTTPFVEEFRRTGDVQAFAVAYAGFLRAFSEPVATPGLLGPEGDRAVMDALYDRVRDRLIAEPERYMIRNIEVAVLLTRK